MKHVSAFLFAVLLFASTRTSSEPASPEYAVRLADFEAEMVRLLQQSSSLEQIESLIGTKYMGIVFRLSDGSWIGILYDHTHLDMVCSCSIALCSDGTWLQSEYHFCGSLGAYAQIVRPKLAGMATEEERRAWLAQSDSHKAYPGMIRALHEADTSSSLDEARRSLSRIGFRPFRPRLHNQQQEGSEPGATDNPDDAQRLREDH